MQQAEAFIASKIGYDEHARSICPRCSHTRKKKNDQCLSIDRKDDGAVVFNCWHCSYAGSIREERPRMTVHQNVVQIAPQPAVLTTDDLIFMESRGISKETCEKAGLFSTTRFFNTVNRPLPCVGFPYRDRGGKVLAHKYRTNTKQFTQDPGGANVFFGLDRLNNQNKTIIIVEGEIDALSITEAEFDNAVSVPNGAPLKIVDRKIDPSEDARFAYVWSGREILAQCERVIIATDGDPQGQALAEELGRRIGKHKCWVVNWPDGCKDANDVLLKLGKEALSDVIIDAKPFPISALFPASEFADDLQTLYRKRSMRGASTSMVALDPFYTVYPGQLTIVTGLPSHGKSSWVDQVLVNMATAFQWKFALCSFENTPPIHIAHLMELKTGKPFFVENMERMNEKEYEDALNWVEEHFGFIDFRDTEPPTIEAILERAQAAVQRMGVRGLVIDPYNYVKMKRASSETDEISDMLARVQAFSKANDVHTWFVAHPTKMYGSFEGSAPRPGGMNVHGSMAWWAKADCGVTVHRGEQPGTTLIDVWKCRYRWVGKQGQAQLSYDSSTGGFS